jgi:integrase
MIVVLWRGGLRVHEALALAELDLDPRRGSLLVRNGRGGKRREGGMDEWGWEHLRPWLTGRAELPVGRLFCIIDGPTRGRPWSGAGVRSLACHSSGVLIATNAIPSLQRHVQHVRDDLAPETVHGLLAKGESLARTFNDGRDQPAPCRELLDKWRRDVGAGRRDADSIAWGVLRVP